MHKEERKMNSLVSWAKKELSRFKVVRKNSNSRRLLLPIKSSSSSNSLATSKSLPIPLPSSSSYSASDYIIDADLGCLQCQRRVSGILTQIDDVESMVFHVFEKKLTFTTKSTS